MAKLPYHNQLNSVPDQIRYSWVAFTTDNDGHYAGLTWGQLNRVHKQHCIGVVHLTDLAEQNVTMVRADQVDKLLEVWRKEYYNYDYKIIVDNM